MKRNINVSKETYQTTKERHIHVICSIRRTNGRLIRSNPLCLGDIQLRYDNDVNTVLIISQETYTTTKETHTTTKETHTFTKETNTTTNKTNTSHWRQLPQPCLERDLQKRPTKETNKRDQQKRPTKETQQRPTKKTYKRDLQKKPTKETQKRPTQNTYKRDLQKRPTKENNRKNLYNRLPKETNKRDQHTQLAAMRSFWATLS